MINPGQGVGLMRTPNELKVYRELSKSFGPEAVAAIMGNIDVETGGSFDPQQQQYGGGNGHGLFQFDAQKDDYFKWLADRPDDVASQIEFMRNLIYDKKPAHEIGPGNQATLQRAMESMPAGELSQLFAEIYERPRKDAAHMDRRKASAIRYANDYST